MGTQDVPDSAKDSRQSIIEGQGQTDQGGRDPVKDLSAQMTEAMEQQARIQKAAVSGPDSKGTDNDWSIQYLAVPDAPLELPNVKISRDHTARVRSEMDYEDLIEKAPGTLCTAFYDGTDANSKSLVHEVTKIAKSLHGKVTFGLVDADEAPDYVAKCGLTGKLPTFVIADYRKPYIHMYTHMNDTRSLKRRLERYERGEKKEPDSVSDPGGPKSSPQGTP